MRCAAILLVVLSGCTLYEPDPVDGIPSCETTQRAYRIDTIEVPTTAQRARELGYDLDGDSSVDNQGGSIIAAVNNALGVDLQGAVDEALDTDAVQIGVTVDECGSPDYALVALVRGLDLDRLSVPPRLRSQAVTSNAAYADEALPATASGGVTRFPVGQLIHPTADAWVDTRALTVVVDTISDAGLEGRLIGGVEQMQAFDAVSRGFQAKVAERQEELGPCTPEACDEVLRTLLDVFDTNNDGEVTLLEIESNSLMVSLLAPDLDLDGDGDLDALSVGIGFHAEPVELVGSP